MMFGSSGLIHSLWLSPWGTVGTGTNVLPPSTERYSNTLSIQTVFSSFGSAVMRM